MPPRKMTLFPLIAATYFIVAGGPYGLEDIVSSAGYRAAILILLITPLIWSVPAALMVAELASALPEEGGYYRWVRRALGNFWGFQEAWLSLTGSIFDMAIYPTLFVDYLGHFSPALTANGRGIWIGLAMVAACALWNLAGTRVVGESSVVMGVLLLSPFVVLAAYAGFHRVTPGSGPAAPHHADLLGGILVAMWNYMGWDNSSTVADEVDQPQRTYPIAMFGAVALVTITYIVPVTAVWLTGLSADQWATGGWADVARSVFGHGNAAGEWIAVAITVGGMVGATGTMTALTMSLSRLPVVLAEDGYLPAILARRSAKTGAPWVAIIVCATVWGLCLNLSFTKLIVLDVLLTGLSILLEFAALVALRLREPDLHRPYRVPGGLPGAIAISSMPVVLLIMTLIRTDGESVGPITALQFGLGIIGLGVALFFIKHRR